MNLSILKEAVIMVSLVKKNLQSRVLGTLLCTFLFRPHISYRDDRHVDYNGNDICAFQAFFCWLGQNCIIAIQLSHLWLHCFHFSCRSILFHLFRYLGIIPSFLCEENLPTASQILHLTMLFQIYVLSFMTDPPWVFVVKKLSDSFIQ